ncbi:MAG: preprotein translocase subunit SecA [Sandaracinus sp.]
MLQNVLKFFLGTSHERQLKKIQPRVVAINELEPKMKKLSDDELKGKTAEFKQKLDNGAKLDDILHEAFAVCREGGRRALGMRHYDVQLIGGIVLHSGKIAEMRTGEGKTLVATLACYLNALEGKGVHVVTVNDYLAKRDAEWMGRLYGFLGLTTGVIVPQQSDAAKKAAYRSDITYGQNNEFGFDYLRDNMKFSIHDYAQRELNFAIVDEVDSILVDEARTPLIISGDNQVPSDKYVRIAAVMPRLRKDEHYVLDEKNHQVALTEEGIELAQQLLVERKIIQNENLYDPANLEALHIFNQSLRAHTLYKRDQQYMVTPGQEVVIIDEFTGRTLAGRRWSDGLHQAVEAKEGVAIKPENRTLATISFQNLFRLYKKLSGMTGTADTEAEEFHKIYSLDVVAIPTNKPILRKDADDLVYKTEREKFKAVFDDLMTCRERGQPVLVGTTSVEKNEALSRMLQKAGVPHNVLNAKQHEMEAFVVAQAGRKGSITIATNMAGRGTDILLGGNPEMLGRTEVMMAARQPGNEALLADKDALEAAVHEAQKKYEAICAAEKKEVLAAGGLQIIGTERHESRRIDNQLRGRAGRQGDPGASRFYLSLEDDLMRIFAGERIQGMMETLGMEEGVPIEHPWVTRSVENAQKKVEERNFDIRKNLLEYDDVMNQQRKSIYTLRRQVLEGQYRTVPTDDEKKAGIEPRPIVDKVHEPYVKQARTVVERMVKLHGAPLPPADADAAARDQWVRQAIEGKLSDVKEVRTAALERNVYDAFGCRSPLSAQGAGASGVEKMAKDPAALVEHFVEVVSMSLTEQRERLLDLTDDLVGAMIEKYTPPNKHFEDWDVKSLKSSYKTQFGIEATAADKIADAELLAQRLYDDAEAIVLKKDKEIPPEVFYRVFRNFYLREIDRQWLEHLSAMEQLRDGIGLRSFGQRDPKKEYKKEGYELFVQMTESIRSAVAANVFRLEVVSEQDARRLEEQRRREVEANQAKMRAPFGEAPIGAGMGPVPMGAGGAPAAAPGAAAQGPRLSAAQLAALQGLRQQQAAAQAAMLQRMSAAGPAPRTSSPGAAPAASSPARASAAPAAAQPQAAQPAARMSAPPKVETVKRDKPKVGRNDPCWCGSGKKYKNCHMKTDGAGGEAGAAAAAVDEEKKTAEG